MPVRPVALILIVELAAAPVNCSVPFTVNAVVVLLGVSATLTDEPLVKPLKDTVTPAGTLSAVSVEERTEGESTTLPPVAIPPPVMSVPPIMPLLCKLNIALTTDVLVRSRLFNDNGPDGALIRTFPFRLMALDERLPVLKTTLAPAGLMPLTGELADIELAPK